MTIALSVARPRSSAPYVLAGSLPRNSAWAQTLELPAIGGVAADISGNDNVAFIFREFENSISSFLTVSVSTGNVGVTDGNTLTISDSNISTLTRDRYYVDLVSVDGSVTTLWASGVVGISNSLAS